MTGWGQVRHDGPTTDQGLEQDFNSLDAQHDASQAYIRSQQNAGWTLVRSKYDDGGFSGGNTDRPALQRLLENNASRAIPRPSAKTKSENEKQKGRRRSLTRIADPDGSRSNPKARRERRSAPPRPSPARGA